MKNHRFGKRSTDNLHTCHKDLQLIMHESLKVSQVDFGISEGHRPTEKQIYLYESGRTRPGPILTKVDGLTKKSKHQSSPSPAADIYAYIPGKRSLAYNKTYLSYIGGVITSVAERLYQEGRITHIIRWGYNWDNDGEIGTDQTFQDMPHYELTKP